MIKHVTDTLSRDLFRVTKTDIKKAMRAILSTNVYKLKDGYEFQNVLDYYNSSLKYSSADLWYENGELKSVLVNYVWCHINVTFHKVLNPLCFASNFQNTTSDDFVYTLMNTLIPIMESENLLCRSDIDSFE